jgi:hypothetical protein
VSSAPKVSDLGETSREAVSPPPFCGVHAAANIQAAAMNKIFFMVVSI